MKYETVGNYTYQKFKECTWMSVFLRFLSFRGSLH